MDLEQRARDLYSKNRDRAVVELQKLDLSKEFASALFKEICNSEEIKDKFVKFVARFPSANVSASVSGLGCRGEGDFFIHRKIAAIVGRTSALVDSGQHDDAGVIKSGKNLIFVSVDGIHSRLSHFPFLAGFHAARASLRDLIVMGSVPKAMFSDVHLGNEGDLCKIFDYTAGISTVGELSSVPLITGSTLRIGGDLVLGDRLTGCVGAVGSGKFVTARKAARPGDSIVMTSGSGGGTITATALFNGYDEIVRETLNVDFLKVGIPFLKSKYIKHVHAMTDVTNGGVRGDAAEISKLAGVKFILDNEKLRMLVNPKVLQMLDELKIDFKGVSVDSLLLILPHSHVLPVLRFIRNHGVDCDVVGRIEKGRGVWLIEDCRRKEMKPKFREEPYTPVKGVVGTQRPSEWKEIQKALDRAAMESMKKKEKVVKWILEKVTERRRKGRNDESD